MIARPRLLPALLAAFGLALLAPPAGAQDKKDSPAKTTDTVRLTDKLAARVSVEKAFEGKLADAVKLLSEAHDLPLVLDPAMARPLNDGDGETTHESKKVKMPKLMRVRLSAVLDVVCQQAEATYLVYPDYIKLIPATHAQYESGSLKQPDPDSPNEEPPLLSQADLQKSRPLIKRALVSGSFKNVPLGEVLDEIAESTGATVVLSPLAGDKAKLPVTARFANTPVDAAVRTLCELVDLGVIEDANVLVVTTRERAAARAKEEEDKTKVRLAAKPRFGGFGGLCAGVGGGGLSGFGGGGVTIPADVPAELARLKEQNEQLQKKVEELQKLMPKK